MKKTLVNVFKFFMITIACLLLGFSVYNCNSSRTTGDKLPMPFGIGMAVVISGSMEPTISIDDMILVKKADEYKLDDMVVFQSNNELIVHRIVNIEDDMITTRGDANNTDDEPIHVSSIKGKVVGIVDNIGWFIDFLKSPIVVITVLVCAILLMEFSFKKEKQEKNDKISKIKEEIRQLKG